MKKIETFFIGSLIISLILCLFSIGEALLMGQLIDIFLNGENISKLIIALLIINVLNYFIKLIRIKIFDKKFINLKSEKQEELIKKISKSDYLCVSKLSIGELSDTLVGLSDNYYNSIKGFVYNHIPNVILMIFSFIVCLIVSWQLTISGFALIPIMFLLGFLATKPMSEKTVKTKEIKSDFNTFIDNSIQLIDTIKVFSMKNWIMEQCQKKSAEINKIDNDIAKIESMSETISMLMGAVPYAVFFIGGAFLVYYDKISIGLFYVFVVIFNFVYQGLPAIQDMMFSLNEIKGTKQRINKIYALKDQILEINNDKNTNIELNENGIFINNVSFSYGEREVFLDYSLKIRKNKFTVIKGENGSGKSTLLKILATIYTPQSGSIYYGNMKLENQMIEQIREHIAFVPQNCFVFEGSIKDNITLGDNSISMSMIEDVCKKACLTNWISGLELGYSHMIAADGKNISVGQSQKINIARALCKNPKYIIFDEFTANLDVVSRVQIMQTIKNISNNVTAVYVTHIHDDIEYADEIIYLNAKEDQ